MIIKPTANTPDNSTGLRSVYVRQENMMCHYTDLGTCSPNHTTALMKPKYLIDSSKFSQASFLLFVFSHTHLTAALMFHDTKWRRTQWKEKAFNGGKVGSWTPLSDMSCNFSEMEGFHSWSGLRNWSFGTAFFRSQLLLEDIFADGFRMAA